LRGCSRPGTPRSHGDGRRLVKGRVERQDTVRFNSGNADITPKDPHARRKQAMHAECDLKQQHRGVKYGSWLANRLTFSPRPLHELLLAGSTRSNITRRCAETQVPVKPTIQTTGDVPLPCLRISEDYLFDARAILTFAGPKHDIDSDEYGEERMARGAHR
jgi:hypothetical protein